MSGSGEGPDPVRCSEEEGRQFRRGVFREVDEEALPEAPEGPAEVDAVAEEVEEPPATGDAEAAAGGPEAEGDEDDAQVEAVDEPAGDGAAEDTEE